MSSTIVERQHRMSTSLVPANSTALSTSVEGLDGFTIKPSGIEMVQRTSRSEGAIPGKFRDKDSGAHFDSMKVVPLRIRSTRVLFPPGGELGAEPICRSDDGRVPSESAAVPQCTRCDLCDHGPKVWAQFKKTKIKPDCQEKLQMLFIDRETSLPYYITIGGMSVGTFKRIISSIIKDMKVAEKKGMSRKLYDYTFEMKPQFVQGSKGSYYVLGVNGLHVVQNPGEFGPLYEEFVLNQQAAESENTVDDAIEGELVDDGSGTVEA